MPTGPETAHIPLMVSGSGARGCEPVAAASSMVRMKSMGAQIANSQKTHFGSAPGFLDVQNAIRSPIQRTRTIRQRQ